MAAFIVVFAGWKLLTGFPVERQPPRRPPVRPRPVVVQEPARATDDEAAGPYTIRDLEEPPSTTGATGTMTPDGTASHTSPPEPRIEAATPAGSATPTAAEPASREMSADAAMLRLATFLRDTNYYKLPPECVAVTSLGYKNAGYTIQATNRCERGTLGRWRVDAVTREVFVRNRAGRFVRP